MITLVGSFIDSNNTQVPSRGLPTAYEKAVAQYVAGGTSMEANTAFVVACSLFPFTSSMFVVLHWTPAAFEVRTGTDMPHTKDDLIRMWDAGSVRVSRMFIRCCFELNYCFVAFLLWALLEMPESPEIWRVEAAFNGACLLGAVERPLGAILWIPV